MNKLTHHKIGLRVLVFGLFHTFAEGVSEG